MSSIPKRWSVLEPLPTTLAEKLSHRNSLILQILFNRGLRTETEIETFLDGQVRYHDPTSMRGMANAVQRILRAARMGEPIVVFGDFDADGVTSTVLMVQTLEALGANVRPYIPHRVDEGYGLNREAIERLSAEGTALLVTVDCGIRSPEEVARANQLGMDVIVTDHHSVRRDVEGRDELPPAFAVINPKRQDDPYPFKELAGVGIAFKLAQMLLAEGRPNRSLQESDLLDLVAIGTVADVMPLPLMGENRALVQRGLAALSRPRRPGLQALMEEARLSPARVTSTAIGFILGPRINAAGRLDSAMLAYDLLSAPDVLTARQRATELGDLNRKRQAMTLELVARAKEKIAAEGEERELFMVSDPEFPSGLVGLVAGRLVEERYRPVMLVEEDQNGSGFSRGSARSIPEFNVTAALDECRDLLVRYGGHAMAAGFTVPNEDLPELRRRLEAIAARELAGCDLAPTLMIDAVLELEDLDWATLGLLQVLEPHGEGNPQPVFVSRNLEVVTERMVGQAGQHLKLTVRDPHASGPRARIVWDAIGFNQGAWGGRLPDQIDLAYTFESNEFNGDLRLQLNIKDLRPAESDGGRLEL